MRESEPILTGDGSAIPPIIVKEIKHLIRKGAKDLTQKWKDSIHLTKKAYDVAGYKIPSIIQKDAWIQYEHLIGFAVKEMAKNRGFKGPDGVWRTTPYRNRSEEESIIPKSKLPLPYGTKF